MAEDAQPSQEALVELEALSEAEILEEVAACEASCAYFVHFFVWLQDKQSGQWGHFHLWSAQKRLTRTLVSEDRVVVLKARQLGITWLVLAYCLWRLLFEDGIAILLFSVGQREAKDLIKRLRGMYERLPSWLRHGEAPKGSLEFKLRNGSSATSLPSTAGDSYTAAVVFVDEADLVPDLGTLLERAEPTVADGGQLILGSRSDKDDPQSPFKETYRGAKAGTNGWAAVFLSWRARPTRTQAWYDELAAGKDDDFMAGNYPETDEEALAARSVNKRYETGWLRGVFAEEEPIGAAGAPAIPGLRVYRAPVAGAEYRIGADPAEGLAHGDDSAAEVVELVTGEQVACFAGKWEPKHDFPSKLRALCHFFNRAPVLVELINHGHATIGALETMGDVPLLGPPGKKPGWPGNKAAKVIACDEVAQYMQDGDAEGNATIHDAETYGQLCQIDKDKLKHPKSDSLSAVDDKADAYTLAQKARTLSPPPKARAEVW